MGNSPKIHIFKFAKFQAVLFGLVGLLLGIIYSFGGLLIDVLVSLDWIASNETPGLSYGTFLAFGALIVMPLLFVVGGYVLGLVEAVLYNIFRKWIGRINIDFFKRNKDD